MMLTKQTIQDKGKKKKRGSVLFQHPTCKRMNQEVVTTLRMGEENRAQVKASMNNES